MANVQALQRQGWYLTAEGINECTENGRNSVDDIIRTALDLDLKDIGERHFPEGLSKNKVDYVDGPFVLQIQKVRNVTAPKDNEESQAAPQVFKLTLTDGHSSCTAIEMEKIPNLGLNTPPGTKLKILGKVPVVHGFLLLKKGNAKILGGRVDKLVENWELKRSLAKHTRSDVGSEGGPPPFIPFGQRRREVTTNYSKKDNFKSLDTNKEKKEDTEFEAQRQATIAEVLQAKEEGRKGKTFGTGSIKQVSHPSQVNQDKDVAKIVEMGFQAEQAHTALKQNDGNLQEAINSLLSSSDPGRGRPSRGTRGTGASDRGGRGKRPQRDLEDEEDFMESKPSAPATLFDFLTTKIPAVKDESKEDKSETPARPSPSANKSFIDATQKRGPPNLPPRLLKEQQRREEERASRQAQRPPPAPPTQRPPPHQAPQLQDARQDSRANTMGSRQPQGQRFLNTNKPYESSQRVLRDQGLNQRYQNQRPTGRPQTGPRDQREQQGKDGSFKKYYDVNTRGPVVHRTLWTSSDRDTRVRDTRNPRPNHHNTDNMHSKYSGQNRSQDQRRPRVDYGNNRAYSRGELVDDRYQRYDPNQAYRHNLFQNSVPQPQHQQAPPAPQPTQSYQAQGQQDEAQQLEEAIAEEPGEIEEAAGSTDVQVGEEHSQQPTDQLEFEPTTTQDNVAVSEYEPPLQTNMVQTQVTQVNGDLVAQNQTYVAMATGPLVQQMQNMSISMPMQAYQQPVVSLQQVEQQHTYSQPQQFVTTSIPVSIATSLPATIPSMEFTNNRHCVATQKTDSAGNRRPWKAMDYCMAKYWEDAEFYRAVILAVNHAAMVCTVHFPDYGNNEEVAFTDIRPLPRHAWESNSLQPPGTAQVVGITVSQAAASMATPTGGVPGILVQGPPGVSYMAPAYQTTEQAYQSSVANLQGTRAVTYTHAPTQQYNHQQKANRIPQHMYIPHNQRPL